jgi:hypothetical protein
MHNNTIKTLKKAIYFTREIAHYEFAQEYRVYSVQSTYLQEVRPHSITVGGGMITVGGGMLTVGGGMVTVGGGMITVGGGMITVGGGMITVGGGMITVGGGIGIYLYF